jgi:hypothetical protein
MRSGFAQTPRTPSNFGVYGILANHNSGKSGESSLIRASKPSRIYQELAQFEFAIAHE